MEKQLLHQVKQLLLNSDMSISQIAEKLHFCDAYYLSRFFRKFEKETPRDYRMKRKGIVKEDCNEENCNEEN